jgi:transmembrane sensor
MTDSQDLLRQIADAGARLDPKLSDRDVDRLVEGARLRRRRRNLRRAGLLTATAVAVVCLTWLTRDIDPAKPLVQTLRSRPSTPPAPSSPASERVLRLADGSLVTPLDPGSRISVTADSSRSTEMLLAHGRGRFEVVRRPERVFSVRAGEVTVTVLGTIFTVERIADRVGVAVERGSVRVDWGVGSRVLQMGESGWFPPLQVRGTSPKASVRPPSHPKLGKPKARLAAAAEPQTAAKPEAPAENAEALLLAADRARLAGRPEHGVELLRLLLREHGDDPRAPLAAFTLGRVLLMELGRPAEAAIAFARVRQLAPGGPFAEDALAREVEAYSQAGQTERARARAIEYLRLYPAGRRAASVRLLGKVD